MVDYGRIEFWDQHRSHNRHKTLRRQVFTSGIRNVLSAIGEYVEDSVFRRLLLGRKGGLSSGYFSR